MSRSDCKKCISIAIVVIVIRFHSIPLSLTANSAVGRYGEHSGSCIIYKSMRSNQL